MDTPPGQAISASLRVAKAMSLARQGKAREAEAIFGGEGGAASDAVSLEVLAVIVTSQGDYPRALRLWEQLLQGNAKHAEAQRMVAALRLWLGRPSWARYVPVLAALLLTLILLGFFLALTAEPARPVKPSAAAPSPVAPVVTPHGSPVSPAPRLLTPELTPPPAPATAGTPAVNFAPPRQPQRHR